MTIEAEVETEAKTEEDNGAYMLTLVHRDMERRNYSLWFDDDGKVVKPPDDARVAQRTAQFFEFKRRLPQAVPKAVFDYLLPRKHPLRGMPEDIEEPIFIEGAPEPDAFEDLGVEEQVGLVHEQLGAMEERLEKTTEALVAAASAPPASAEMAEVVERQEHLGARFDELLDMVGSLVEQKGAKAAPKKRGRPKKNAAKAANAVTKAKTVTKAEAEVPVVSTDGEPEAQQEITADASGTPA